MAKNWKKDIARDLIALGGIVFYLLVLARALIGPFYLFLYQLLIALAIIVVLSFFIRNLDSYVARGLILAFFTSLYYRDVIFSMFAFMIYIALIMSALYLGTDRKRIFQGILGGIIGILGGYFLSSLML